MGEEGRLCSLGSKVCWRIEGVSLRVCGGDAPIICRGRRLRYLFHSDGAALKVCVVQVPYGVILLLNSVHRSQSRTKHVSVLRPFLQLASQIGFIVFYIKDFDIRSHCRRAPAQWRSQQSQSLETHCFVGLRLFWTL